MTALMNMLQGYQALQKKWLIFSIISKHKNNSNEIFSIY